MPDGYTVSSSDPNLRIYEPDQVLIQEDTDGDGSIFILHEGTLGVFKGPEQGAEITAPPATGAILGEMSEILGVPRTASIKTMEDFDERGDPIECKVYVYTGGLESIVSDTPEIAVRLMESLATRLQDTTNLHKSEADRAGKIEERMGKFRKQAQSFKKDSETNEKKLGQLKSHLEKQKGILGMIPKKEILELVQ